MKKKNNPSQPSLFDELTPGVHCVTPNYAEKFREQVGAPPPVATAPTLPPDALDLSAILPVAPALEMALQPLTSPAQPRKREKAPVVPPVEPEPKVFDLSEIENPTIEHHRAAMRAYARSMPIEIKKPDRTLQRDLKHGWILPVLMETEYHLWGRWQYWHDIMIDGELSDAQPPIPQIDFTDGRHPGVVKMLDASLSTIMGHDWRGYWSSATHFDYFLDWLLYALGYHGQKELPREPHGCEGASTRLYQVFNLDLLLTYPGDYLGEIMAESGFGKALAFYPTPLQVSTMMASMTFAGHTGDTRGLKTCDPCVGSGRMLLAASNYSLSLYGIDLNPLCVKATIINGALYAPWLYASIPFLDRGRNRHIERANALTESMPDFIERENNG